MTDAPEPEREHAPPAPSTALPWCSVCEHFAPPVDGDCPDCGHPIEYVEEDL